MYFDPYHMILVKSASCLLGLSTDLLTALRMTNTLCVLLDFDYYLCTLISSLAIDQYLLSYRLAPLPTYSLFITVAPHVMKGVAKNMTYFSHKKVI